VVNRLKASYFLRIGHGEYVKNVKLNMVRKMKMIRVKDSTHELLVKIRGFRNWRDGSSRTFDDMIKELCKEEKLRIDR
jgi:hypothetical protein